MTPEEQRKEILDSRTKKTLIHCPVCVKPIGRRQGNKWWIERNYQGMKGLQEVEQNQSTPYGSYKMNCLDPKCDGGHVFAWINETVTMSDELTATTAEE